MVRKNNNLKEYNKRRKKRRKFRYKRFFGFLVILVAIIFGSYYAYGAFMHRQAENLSKAQVEDSSGDKGLKPSIDAQYKDARFEKYNNILIIGVDDSNSDGSWDKHRYADALEILSFDENNKSLRVITVPRNLIVASTDKGDVTIGDVYYNDGGAATVNALANYLEIPITQYVAIDRKALGEIVDALGGVEFYVAKDMNYEDPTNGTTIHINHGYQQLDGARAAQYLSYRSDELGDSGRMQRQQQFLKLLYKKFTSVEGIKAAPKIFRVLKSNADTNIKIASLGSMTDFINAYTTDKVQVNVLPGKGDAQGNWVINPAMVKIEMEKLFPIPKDDKDEKK